VLASGASSAQAQTTGVPGIEKFRTPGPETVGAPVAVGICTRFLPPLGPAGSRPGLGWANGTGGTPGTYTGILTRVASYGTLVTAANTTNSGSGNEVRQCMEELVSARTDSNGRFATAGHSQGGSGSLNAAIINAGGRMNPSGPPNPRVVVTCPVQLDGIFTAQSMSSSLRGTATGPALIMCGGSDTLAPCTSNNNGDTKLAQATVPVTRISVVGAPHVGPNSPTGNGGLYAALVTTCVEAALGGDAQASAALRPGGATDNGVINRISTRNFPAVQPPDPGIGGVIQAIGAIIALLAALGSLGSGS
jgi:hypothetical protein